MPIRSEVIDAKGSIARAVTLDSENPTQACRVVDEGCVANQLWFFEPLEELKENELAGVPINRSIMKSDPVILRFNSAASVMPVINDLMTIFADLRAAGL